MKEFVEKLREKADIFEKSGCAVDGIVKDYRKSADMIEKLCGKSNISGFVEKLIERLKKEQYDMIKPYAGNDLASTMIAALDIAIEIVNQLAEEYNQDSTKNNQGWIPCSERLPKTNGVYQITRELKVGEDIYRISGSAYFDGQDTWHNDNRVNHGREYLKDIIAWQPLPEPYKPEETQEEPQTNFYAERFNR